MNLFTANIKKLFTPTNVEKRGIVSDLTQTTQTETHRKKEFIISYTTKFKLDELELEYKTPKPIQINNGDEIIVNASKESGGKYKINFYKNFTCKNDNFALFSYRWKQIFLTLIIVMLSAAIMTIPKNTALNVVGYISSFVLIFSIFFTTNFFLKLNKRLKYFKSL